MWEDNGGSSLRLGNTAVPDPLLPIIILLQGGKEEMACTDTSSGMHSKGRGFWRGCLG